MVVVVLLRWLSNAKMTYGICLLTMVPMRAEPSHRSELVNQMLFGEVFGVVGQTRNDEWLEVKLQHDKYVGWVDAQQVVRLDKSAWKQLTSVAPRYTTQTLDLCSHLPAHETTILVPGSTLWLPDDQDFFSVAGVDYEWQGEGTQGEKSRETMVEFACQFINVPYLWGGRTPLGIDCSGFAQLVYRLAGYHIPRDASQQAKVGDVLGFIEESRPGDLAFFDNEEGKITHVGIILPQNQIIHASGKVRIDGIDQYGIYRRDTRTHSHRLRLIKTLF